MINVSNQKLPRNDDFGKGIINNEEYMCPIYFSNHDWGGVVREIENFTNLYFDFNVRSTLLNGKPYFASSDVLKCLNMDTKNTSTVVMRAIDDLLHSEYAQLQNSTARGNETPLQSVRGSEYQQEFLPPLQTVRGVEYQENQDFNRFESELYFYINLKVQHYNRYGITNNTQYVRTMFISEPVLYTLIFRSNKQEAVNLRAWLSIEVLPKMRSIGRERTDQALSILDNLAAQGKLDDILALLQHITDNAVSKEEVFSHANNILNVIGNCTKSIIQNQYNTENDILQNQFYTTNDIIQREDAIYNQTVKTASGLNSIFG